MITMARNRDMNSIEAQSQHLMEAIGEQRRLRRHESGSWRTYVDMKWSHDTVAEDDGESLSEPPLSLNVATGERNYHLVGSIFDFPLQYGGPASTQQQHSLQQKQQTPTSSATIVPPSNQSTPINLSPLTTASSVCVMEKEYDRDTWRMYQRIKSARLPATTTATSAITAANYDRSNSMPLIPYRQMMSDGMPRCGAEYATASRHDFETAEGGSYLMSASANPNLVQYEDDHDDEIFEMDLDS